MSASRWWSQGYEPGMTPETSLLTTVLHCLHLTQTQPHIFRGQKMLVLLPCIQLTFKYLEYSAAMQRLTV